MGGATVHRFGQIRSRRRAREAWGLRGPFLAGTLLISTVVILALRQDPERRALDAMSNADRAALFQRTRANVRALCAKDMGFGEHCVEEARFLARFPECDGACRAEIEPVLPGPTR